ncbi:MAG: hypothetical protein JXD21_02490, partial [Candidatus Omnitrophica bacterium]|nr:hypothetical protein [Candidatus Omnitrophota bacterium]
ANIDLVLSPKGSGAISVPAALNYETLVTADDDIPNKKYVDDAITSGSGVANLDEAYDGGGAGAGRAVTVDNGAVQFTGSNAADETLEITNSGNGGVLLVENTGTGDSFRVNDAAGDTTPFVIDDAGNVGIGTTDPTLRAADAGFVLSSVTDAKDMFLTAYSGSGPAAKSDYELARARGSEASPTIVNNGDSLGTLRWRAWDSNEFLISAYIEAVVDGAPANNSMPTKMLFYTNNGTTTYRRMTLAENGYVGIGQNDPDALLALRQSSEQYPEIEFRSDYNGGGYPQMTFFKTRNNGALSDDDWVGALSFSGYDSTTAETEFAWFAGKAIDVTNGTEDGGVELYALKDGGSTNVFIFDTVETVFNNDEADIDFRVAGDNETDLFFVDAANDQIGIKTNAPNADLVVMGGVGINRNVAVATGDIDISGSYLTNGADYAEYFKIAQDCSVYQVVSLDETKRIRPARRGDKFILGIVSEKPSVIGNSELADDDPDSVKPVAFMGRVKAQVIGSVEFGDWLTVSNKPGYLMKAQDGDERVARAMETNSGIVEVLIGVGG